jgi:EmrB/QacA subfamily drug resistance transporter
MNKPESGIADEEYRGSGNWILAATILGSSITFIDGTVVNVALPVLQTQLGASVADAQWIVEAYALMLAALLLVGGSLGDYYGRKKIFAAGVFVFAAASVWCGLSPGITQLIFARAVQGIGAAMLVPGSLAIISASFSAEKRGAAIGTWSGFTAIAAGFGPVLGGWLIAHASWRWIFFINVPVAIIVLLIVWRRVPESRDEDAAKGLDYPGALLATIGLGGVVFALINYGTLGVVDSRVLASLIAGLTALVLFLIVEWRSPAPMMPLGLFRSKTFAGANLLTLFLYSALTGIMFFLPFNLIQIQNYSTTAAGSALVPFVLMMFFLSRWSGGLVSKFGSKLPLVLGPVIAAIGFFLFSLPSADSGSYWTSFFPAIIVMSFGMTVSVAPLTTTVMGAVGTHQAGIASGINNAVSRTAGLLAVAALGILMLATFNRAFEQQVTQIDVSAETRSQLLEEKSSLAAVKIPDNVSGETQAAVRQAVAVSFVSGFRLVCYVSAALALLSALAAWLLIEGRKKENKPNDQKPPA